MAIHRAIVIPVAMAKNGDIVIRTFLKEWRLHRGLTQQKLGELAGLEAPSISQYETGKQWFSDDSLANLARALQCSPAQILEHDPTRPDSFWPLFDRAERLEGRDRKRLFDLMQAWLA